MATWTSIPDANLDPDKPARSIDALALRDNPIAIAEGAAGAPAVEDAALDTTVTAAGSTWVANRMTSIGTTDVGALLFAYTATAVTVSFGSTIDASANNLKPASSGTSLGTVSTGTWRCLGAVDNTGTPADSARATLWQRTV